MTQWKWYCSLSNSILHTHHPEETTTKPENLNGGFGSRRRVIVKEPRVNAAIFKKTRVSAPLPLGLGIGVPSILSLSMLGVVAEGAHFTPFKIPSVANPFGDVPPTRHADPLQP